MIAVPIFAASYRASYIITETNGTSYEMLPVIKAANTTWLVDNGYMDTDALDTRVETLGGIAQPHLVTDDSILTAYPVSGDSQTNLYFTTGNTPLTSMDIIVGNGGYVTITDAAALEFGNNFEVELKGYFNTSSSGMYYFNKSSAFSIFSGSVGNIVSAIVVAAPTWTQADSASGTGWTNPTNAIDGNTGTYANHAVSGNGSTGTLTLTFATPQIASSLRYYINSNPVYNINLAITDNTGFTLFDDAATRGAYTTVTFTNPREISELNLILTNTDNHAVDMRVMECDLGVIPGVSATMASGEHTVIVAADGVDLTLNIDSVEEDSTALAGASAPDNANNWILYPDHYWNYYKHTVSGTLIAHYQPEDIISGTTLPDLEGAAQNGVITWGSNPAGISVSIGGMVSLDQPGTATEETTVPTDILPQSSSSDWYVDPEVSTSLLTNPLRPFVTILSNTTSMSESQAWRLLGLALVLLLTASSLKVCKGHLLIVGAACAAAIIGMVAMTIFPLWALVFAAIAIIGGLVSERSPSI